MNSQSMYFENIEVEKKYCRQYHEVLGVKHTNNFEISIVLVFSNLVTKTTFFGTNSRYQPCIPWLQAKNWLQIQTRLKLNANLGAFGEHEEVFRTHLLPQPGTN